MLSLSTKGRPSLSDLQTCNLSRGGAFRRPPCRGFRGGVLFLPPYGGGRGGDPPVPPGRGERWCPCATRRGRSAPRRGAPALRSGA